jgi:hypothetical protein
MNNTQHTQGPWFTSEPKVSEIADGQTYFSIGSRNPERRGIVYVMPGFFYPHSVQTPEEMAANAKLIAAAPEMLEALIEAVSTIKHLRDNEKEYISVASVNMSLSEIEKAINKATK